MQHLVVLEIVQQRARHDVGARRQEHAQARHAGGALVGALQEQGSGRDSERTFSRCTRRPRRQVSMPMKTQAAMNKRQPAALGNLERIGDEEDQIADAHGAEQADHQKQPASAIACPPRCEALKVSITITPVTAMP